MESLSLNQQMMVLVLQYLDEENLKETMHKMEQESGIYFNLKYFEKNVLAGEWKEVEKYLRGFTNIDDNAFSTKMFFEIRKQNYYEALDSNDRAKAAEILVKDLKIFSTYDQALYKQLTNLITLDNLRENTQLSQHQDVRSARVLLMTELRKLINHNNKLNNKLKLPTFSESRLRHLINHGLNWQHRLCKNPQPSPEIATILTDHTCDLPNAANHQSRAVVPFLSAPVAPKANALPAWMVNGNPSSSSRSLVARTASALPGPSNLANIPRHTRTPITHAPISDQETRRLTLPQTFAEREADIAIARSTENRRNSNDVAKPWKLKEIVRHTQCRTITMPESIGPGNKVCLLYTKPGTALVAIGSKGVMKMWNWSLTKCNPIGKELTRANPEHLIPKKGIFLTNAVPNNKDAIPCLDISNNDSYGLAACGGIVSLFKMVPSYKVLYQFMSPPPAATCIAFIPQDNNIAAIGREDSVIHIFSIRHGELIAELKGHQKHIISIAFSLRLNIMVSAGADAQLISWNMNTWSMNTSASIQLRTGDQNAAPSETKVQFHSNQELLLACHETRLVIYDASRMKPIIQWLPQDNGMSACAISSATYSSNFEQIYATFTDGNIGIFDAGCLVLRCRIAPSAYLYQTPSISQNVYPLVVAASPKDPNRFAIALSNGIIKVFEPNI